MARYRALFSVPGLRRVLVSSLLGRLPEGMFSLALLLFVRERTGSFLAAGLTVGAFTLAGALTGPVLGAMVDRLGQTLVLLPAAAAQASTLVVLVFVTQSGAPVALIVALAALAGAGLPPIEGCVRAMWPAVAHDAALQTAYALDATAQEVIWTLGPLLVGLTAGLVSPAAPLLMCAALTIFGTGYFAASALSRSWQSDAGTGSWRGAVAASAGLRVLLCSALLAGGVIGAVEVGLTALAVREGAQWSAGLLLALFSVGSIAGGLAYSAKTWTLPIGRRYAAILMAMALGVVPLIAVDSIAAGFPLSALAGLALAPMIACQFSLVGALAAPGTLTEACTWHRSAIVAGVAGGTALGGWLVEAHDVGAAFALGGMSVALAGLVVVLRRRCIEAASSPLASPARSAALTES
jgi:predicted MFS family arabinose efflux permease